MIGILRCLDGQLIVEPRASGARRHIVADFYSKPTIVVRTVASVFDPLSDAEAGMVYQRQFERGKVLRDRLTQDSDGHPDGGVFGFMYFEKEQVMPPEILSRRMQEVESEWLRLGRLLEDLRALEKS